MSAGGGLASAKSAALRCGEYEHYLNLHGSHNRLEALARIVSRIADDECYWRCVGDVWTGDDSPSRNGTLWAAFWSSDRPGRAACMSDEERAALGALPASVPVWRGVGRRDDAGWSWTTDPERAIWFARWHVDNDRVAVLYGRSSRPTVPMVKVGTVARDRILALFSGRGESELVIRPGDVTAARVVSVEDAEAEWGGR